MFWPIPCALHPDAPAPIAHADGYPSAVFPEVLPAWKVLFKGHFSSLFFSLWMRSQGAIKCRVSHLAEPEEMMLTKSLIYPIAAVTSISFWRRTEKLEWTRWTLAWEKRGLAPPSLS